MTTKKLFILGILLIAAALESNACDVCGCSLGGSYYGILPQFQKNFIGLRWSQAKFYAHMNHGAVLGEEHSHDTYTKLELWGRYYINDKIQVFAFVPYSYNNMKGTEQKIKTQGLGDISILANYLILNTGESKTKKLKHTLMAGAGVKLPTGKYDLEDNGLIVNRNFQLGTGSVDFVMSGVYTIRHQKIGITTETGYKINTRNSHEYRFGNQFHVSGKFFYWHNIKSISLLPNMGVYYEKAARHRDGEIIQTNTGGDALLLSAGLELYYQQFSVGLTFQNPVKQQYNSDEIAEITSKDRLSVSLTYSF
jgi:Putative MetA-pathway of phenol degradation